jgi:hypothetical protein
MDRLIRGVIVSGIGLAVAGSAQAPPSLAGKWTLIRESAAPEAGRGAPIPATAGSLWGDEFTISQDAARLTIERPQFSRYDMQQPMRFVYALDGLGSRNVINMGRGPQEQISRAVWKGNALVITTQHGLAASRTAGLPSIEVTHVLSVDEAGALVIEATRAGPDSPVSTTRTRYKKG